MVTVTMFKLPSKFNLFYLAFNLEKKYIKTLMLFINNRALI